MEKFFIFIWAVSTQESYIKSYRAICVLCCTKYTYWSTKSTSIMYVIRKRKNKWAEMTEAGRCCGRARLQLSQRCNYTSRLVKSQFRPVVPLNHVFGSDWLHTVQAAFILLWETGGIMVVLSQLGHLPSTKLYPALPSGPPPSLSFFLCLPPHRPPPTCFWCPSLSSRYQFTGRWPRSHGMDVTGGHEWPPRSVITHTQRMRPKVLLLFLNA